MMVEKGIRYEICHAIIINIMNNNTANNKYMKNYNNNIESS